MLSPSGEQAVKGPVPTVHLLIGADRRCPKGSVWILEVDGDRFAPALYLPDP